MKCIVKRRDWSKLIYTMGSIITSTGLTTGDANLWLEDGRLYVSLFNLTQSKSNVVTFDTIRGRMFKMSIPAEASKGDLPPTTFTELCESVLSLSKEVQKIEISDIDGKLFIKELDRDNKL